VSPLFVHTLIAPRWNGGTHAERHVREPSAADVEDAIRALNGRDLNDLYLNLDDPTWMGIGGGAGKYLVSVTFKFGTNDERHFVACDRTRTGQPPVDMVVGGQPSDYPAHQIVDLSHALVAARTFVQSGTLSADIEWEAV
jgi:Immunity protein Imm1